MGKKAPATAPAVPPTKAANSNKKAAAPTTAAENAQAAENASLTQASAILDSVSLDVLLALVKAKSGPTLVIPDSDDEGFNTRLTSRDQLTALCADIKGIDTTPMLTPADQQGQFVDGTLLLVDSLLEAANCKDNRRKFSLEALAILQRRTRHWKTCLKAAGPVAGGSFAAAYELWHSQRLQFTKPDFKPEEVDKVEVAAAMTKDKHSTPRGPARPPQPYSHDRQRPRPQTTYRNPRPYPKPRHSPKGSNRDRSRSRSPAKRR